MPKASQLLEPGVDNITRLAHLNKFAESVYAANPENSPKKFMDISDPEVKQFLLSLHQNDVKYILVGGVASVFHGHVRTTQDLDLWIKETQENRARLVAALRDAKVAGADLFLNTQLVPGWSTITIGENGFVADFMGYTKAFSAANFDECYGRARKGVFEGIPLTVIHLDDLITEKSLLSRAKDKDDLENLKRIRKRQRAKGL